MKYVSAIAFTLMVPFLIIPLASAGESPAYSMSESWQACSTSGIPDSRAFTECITYPDTGKDFETCEKAPRAIYFSRHAEKRFRDIDGQNNAPGYILSEVGQKMAEHLANVFASVPVRMIYTSDQTRTRQTACPLMRGQGVERQLVCKTETKSERFLQGALCKSHENQVVVVVGHADTVNEMLINLKVVAPREAPEIRLGELYKVTFQGGKGTLQTPPIRYWNCDASECHKDGALDVKLD